MQVKHIDDNRVLLGEALIASLESRLAEGDRMIDAARAKGEDVLRMEDHWISLLHQYERAVEDLSLAA